MHQNPVDLCAGQNYRNALILLGPHHAFKPFEILLQNMSKQKQKQQSIKGLILCRSGNLLLDCQMGQKALHILDRDRFRSFISHKISKFLDPIGVGLQRSGGNSGGL